MVQLSEEQKVAHLLRRFGLGASEREIDYYGKNGAAGAMDMLLDFESVEDPVQQANPLSFANANGNINLRVIQLLYYSQFLATHRPLQFKLSLFWHDHFAVSAQKVLQPPLMYAYTQTLLKGAAGKFPDLLEAISKDPAMIFWLDNQENVRGKPNENFAREVMELFTMGVDNGYTEKDIQEAARAFTGWAYRRPPQRRQTDRPSDQPQGMVIPEFFFRQGQHDGGAKTVLGKSGRFSGEQVLEILVQQPQTPRYITKKMWEWFAYRNPEEAVIERIAAKYTASGQDIKVLVRAIMEAPEFYSAKSLEGVIKNPIDFCIPIIRAFGIGEQVRTNMLEATPGDSGRRALAVGAAAQTSTTSMGMELLYPPDVAGWEGGNGWITTATMVERIKWADRLFTGRGAQAQGVALYGALGRPSSPESLTERLLSVLDAERLKPKAEAFSAAARKAVGETVTVRNVSQAVSSECRLIFGSPEYQFL